MKPLHLIASILTLCLGYAVPAAADPVTVIDMLGSASASTAYGSSPSPLGFGTPPLGPVTVTNGLAVLDVGSFTASANLGPLSPQRSSAFVTYDMRALVTGSFGLGGPARLGDASSVTADGTGVSLKAHPVNTVPESSGLLLGVVALGAIKARRLIARIAV